MCLCVRVRVCGALTARQNAATIESSALPSCWTCGGSARRPDGSADESIGRSGHRSGGASLRAGAARNAATSPIRRRRAAANAPEKASARRNSSAKLREGVNKDAASSRPGHAIAKWCSRRGTQGRLARRPCLQCPGRSPHNNLAS